MSPEKRLFMYRSTTAFDLVWAMDDSAIRKYSDETARNPNRQHRFLVERFIGMVP
jgi:hypothetical protein